MTRYLYAAMLLCAACVALAILAERSTRTIELWDGTGL
jgi:hypothetical protein